MKVAIIHDWLVTYAGAERVLEQMIAVYPQADIFSTVDVLTEATLEGCIGVKATNGAEAFTPLVEGQGLAEVLPHGLYYHEIL